MSPRNRLVCRCKHGNHADRATCTAGGNGNAKAHCESKENPAPGLNQTTRAGPLCPHPQVAVCCPRTSEVVRFGSLSPVDTTPPQSTLLSDVRREITDDRSITIHAHQATGLPNGKTGYHGQRIGSLSSRRFHRRVMIGDLNCQSPSLRK
ncbi:hypothetical protein Pan54_17160 [Rubinisphaera italica]|uniref:Uncharacterized protein n=1 Tax=Rubinisphaera italica TaxID=2527969 RepID=A0A5C5XDW8_9PLAN|nr:hypothetical protein Pan54_17160 [Rubinisphaera italica]